MNRESAIELAELVNSLSNNINALEALKIDAPLSDVIITQVVSQKLEPTFRKAWEIKLNDTPFPPLGEFIRSLKIEDRHCKHCIHLRQGISSTIRQCKGRMKERAKSVTTPTQPSNINCKKCKGRHTF
jgi:hypothetical protein